MLPYTAIHWHIESKKENKNFFTYKLMCVKIVNLLFKCNAWTTFGRNMKMNCLLQEVCVHFPLITNNRQ